MDKGTRKDTGERGSVEIGDDTRKKPAVTCISRIPPSSSRAPNSQLFFVFLSQEFCNLLLLDVLTDLDLDLGLHCHIHLPTVSSNSSVILEHNPESPDIERSKAPRHLCGAPHHCRHLLEEWSPTYRWLWSHLSVLALVGALIRITAEPVT